jgi:mono/diheme cytochrome c family protein
MRKMGFSSRKRFHRNRFAALVGTLLVATLAAPAFTPQLMLRAAPAPVGNANDGKVFWQAQMCQYCHGVQAEGAWGPDLAGRGLSEAGLPPARCVKPCQHDIHAA